jgi:gluconolactonase
MIRLLLSICCTTLLACSNPSSTTVSTTGEDSADAVLPDTRISILDPEGAALIDSTEKVRNLAGGFKWTEGPLYIANGDYLIFSDIPNNRVMKWKEGEGLTTYLNPAGYTGPGRGPENEPGSNGLILDKDGRLVLCQHGDRRIARMKAPLDAPKAEYETVADRYMGKRFNSPNDAVYHPNGNLYLTDPPYGLEKGEQDSAMELDIHGVYRVTPDGKVDLVTSEFKWPNGIALTNDGKYLLVGHSDGNNMVWMKYELGADGLSVGKSVFYKISDAEKDKPGAPDGMKIGSKGHLFASGPGGVWIFNSSGKPVARIYTNQATSNCALSEDEKTLYTTCDDYLYSVKLK